jgi:glyoxylase-like metal-dependent hydrolase (beta-lactamase superfamily II)
VFERAVFEATNPGLSGYWQGVFPGEIPEKPETPDRLETTSIELEGSEIRVIDIGQGDTEHSTIVHVPSIRAVVGGDVVYNEVHMMTAETNARSRQEWIDNLNQIASLDPQTVVSGHHRVGAPNDPKSIGESQQYLRDFSRVVETEETIEDIVKAMLERQQGPPPRLSGHRLTRLATRGLAPTLLMSDRRGQESRRRAGMPALA